MAAATGSFEVEMTPVPLSEGEVGPVTMVLRKTYTGGVTGEATGRMLMHRTGVEGSAGYVALESVHGSVEGRAGSFVLQHFGLMDRGDGSLRVAVIPDSGTDELAGIGGELSIDIAEDGTHHYRFEYRFG